jgi:hypothetical protein
VPGGEVAPVDPGAQPPDHQGRHRSGGGERLALGQQELQRHHAHPGQLDRLGAVPGRPPHGDVLRRRGAGDAEHQRDVGPVEVRVEDADPQPPPHERPPEGDRDRRLADPALAARDGDHLADQDAATVEGFGAVTFSGAP